MILDVALGKRMS